MKPLILLLLSAFTAFGAASASVSYFKGIQVDNILNSGYSRFDIADISGTAIDLATSSVFSKNLTANTTFTYANLAEGLSWTVILTNGAAWTVTWPTTTWPGNAAPPVMDTGAGVVNIFSFLRSGGVTFGTVARGEIATSAGLAAQLTDETGTGAAVFGTSPTIVTPTIASFANATHTHLNAAGGGTLTSASLATMPAYLLLTASDETTAITAGTGKVFLRVPYPLGMTVTAVYVELTTAQASGAIFTVDVNEAGTSVISTKATIDNTEEDSASAVTPLVISDATLAFRAKMSVDVDQVGDGTGKGLKVLLIGTTP